MVAEEDTFRGDQGTSLIKVVCSYPMMKETMVNHKNECLPHLFGNLQNRFSHFLQPAMCRQRHVEGCPLTTHWVEGVPINEDQWPEHVRWSCVLIPAEAIGPLRRRVEVIQGEKVLVRPSQLCGKGSDVDRDGWFESRCLCSDACASFWKHNTERALNTLRNALPFCPLRSEMSIRDPTLQRRQTRRCWRPDVRVGISTIIHVKVMFSVSANEVGARVSAWRGAGKALLSPLLWMG